jgi:hypothetical protein
VVAFTCNSPSLAKPPLKPLDELQDIHMNTFSLPWTIVAAVLVVALFAVAVWFFAQKRNQSERLKDRFGPEYGRTVGKLGGQRKAESELMAREERVEHLAITPLAPAEAARFSQAWNTLQSRFVDNPQGVVVQADQLVRELMLKRGYPMVDFEHRRRELPGGAGDCCA